MGTYPVPCIAFGHGITLLGVIRSLGRAGIPTYSVSDHPDFHSYSRYHRPLPIAEFAQPGHLAQLLSALPFEGAVLAPCTDAWCLAVARRAPALRSRFHTISPPLRLMEALADKALLAEMLENAGVPHPRTRAIGSLEEAEALPERAFAGVFVKPRNSQEFSKRYRVKAFPAENREQGLARLRRTFADGFSVVLQEYVPGPATNHYFLDGLVDRRGSSSFFARRRLRMNPPEFGNSSLTVSVSLDEMRPAVDSLGHFLAEIGYRGIFSAEFKLDSRDQLFKLIEVNARPWWLVDFAEYCGFPICRMAYEDALGLPVEPLCGYRVGRYGVILTQDFQAFRTLKKRRELTWWRWMRSWVGAHDLTFRWSDPAPALAQIFLSAERRVHRRIGGSLAAPVPTSNPHQ